MRLMITQNYIMFRLIQKGEIGWESGTFNIRGRDSHVIELLTEATPDAYKAYLREKGVSYVIAGREELDCQIAMEKLYSLFHIKKLLLCGGGIADWSFLRAGMVDELSLLLAPVTDGEQGKRLAFRLSARKHGVTAGDLPGRVHTAAGGDELPTAGCI